MNNANNMLIPILGSAIKESLNNFEAQKEENSLSDLYLRFDSETTILSIYDDMENELQKVNLEKEQESIPDAFEKQLTTSIKQVLHNLTQEGAFDKEFIFKPFAVSLVDDDFIITQELLFLDDETMKLDDNLFLNIDKELDDFLKDLLSR